MYYDIIDVLVSIFKKENTPQRNIYIRSVT